MTDTPHLRLPLLAAAQAQKHVTHNEALAILDALLHLAVKDRDRGEPPENPAEGDRHIVAQNPTGAWAGKSGFVAVFGAGGWEFHAPKEGWLAWATDENALLVHDGSAWNPFGSGSSSAALQNLALLGIGTVADAANPFAAKLNKALWTARTAAEGGDGDLRFTLNKEAAADVLSFLVQRGFEGRAEFGLIGTTIGASRCPRMARPGTTRSWSAARPAPCRCRTRPEAVRPSGRRTSSPPPTGRSRPSASRPRAPTSIGTSPRRGRPRPCCGTTRSRTPSSPTCPRAGSRAAQRRARATPRTSRRPRPARSSTSPTARTPTPTRTTRARSPRPATGRRPSPPTRSLTRSSRTWLRELSRAGPRAGTGDPEDLTGAQATALLDVMVGSGASARKGLAPAPPASAGTSLFLREDATWAAPPAGGGGLSNPLAESEPSTPASGVSLYARHQAGRRLPAWKEPSGRLGTVFPHIARTRSGLLLAAGGTTLQALGISPAAVGTATARTPAATNLFTSTKRIGYVSAATAGSSAELRTSPSQYWRGNAAGLGGFHLIARFGLSSAAAVAGQRCFVGLAATAAALANADPSAIVDMVGIGNDSADTTFSIMHNDGTGTATKVALGASFPANTLGADLYELQLFCPPNGGSIDYRVERLNTGQTASGTLATDLPTSTAFLCPHLWVNNGATAAACAIDLVSLYVEADV